MYKILNTKQEMQYFRKKTVRRKMNILKKSEQMITI